MRPTAILPRRFLVVAISAILSLWVASTLTLAAGARSSRDDGKAAIGRAPRLPDGRYTNLVGKLSHGTLSVRFPFFLRRVAGAFTDRPGAPQRVPNDGAFLRENAARGVEGNAEPTVTWIGHSTLLVQLGQTTFLTDPIWSKTASPISFAGPRRFVAPGMAIADLPPIDFVVVSHNHYDHLDLASLVVLAERDETTRFFVPAGNAKLLRKNGIENVVELDWGESLKHADVTVHCLPAQHWSKRGLGDDLETLWSSWAVISDTRRFYFAGDTGYFDGFSKIGRALGPFDLAAVPIGAYEPRVMMEPSHMNPEEAVRAALDLHASRAVGVHFGTFDLTDEPLAEPPQRFMDAPNARTTNLEGAGSIDPMARWVFQIGETRFF